MPFISESITNPAQLRQCATSLATHHVLIRPLALPVVPRTETRHAIRMRSVCMPAAYREAAEAIRGAPVRADDVWVLSGAGGGAEAVQLLVERLLRGANGEELGEGSGADEEVAPLFEQSTILPYNQRSAHQRPSWERCQRLPTQRPRVLRSHLPYLLLPVALWRQQPRIIYLIQSPARTAAAYYREYRLLHGYRGSAAEFAQLWQAERLAYGGQQAHEEDFVRLEADGVRNVRCVKFDVETEERIGELVDQVAGLLNVEWLEEREEEDGETDEGTESGTGQPSRDEIVRWFTGELAEERQFRAAVARSDRHFKRGATLDFSVPKIDGIE